MQKRHDTTKRGIPAILVAGVWVSLCEFSRNELILKSVWVDHYRSMGLTFPSELINGAICELWSLLFATVEKRFSDHLKYP